MPGLSMILVRRPSFQDEPEARDVDKPAGGNLLPQTWSLVATLDRHLLGTWPRRDREGLRGLEGPGVVLSGV